MNTTIKIPRRPEWDVNRRKQWNDINVMDYRVWKEDIASSIFIVYYPSTSDRRHEHYHSWVSGNVYTIRIFYSWWYLNLRKRDGSTPACVVDSGHISWRTTPQTLETRRIESSLGRYGEKISVVAAVVEYDYRCIYETFNNYLSKLTCLNICLKWLTNNLCLQVIVQLNVINVSCLRVQPRCIK